MCEILCIYKANELSLIFERLRMIETSRSTAFEGEEGEEYRYEEEEKGKGDKDESEIGERDVTGF